MSQKKVRDIFTCTILLCGLEREKNPRPPFCPYPRRFNVLQGVNRRLPVGCEAVVGVVMVGTVHGYQSDLYLCEGTPD